MAIHPADCSGFAGGFPRHSGPLSLATLVRLVLLSSCAAFACRGPSFLLPLTQRALVSSWNDLDQESQHLYDRFFTPAMAHSNDYLAQVNQSLQGLQLTAGGLVDDYPLGVTWSQADAHLLEDTQSAIDDGFVTPILRDFEDPSLWSFDVQGLSRLSGELEDLNSRWQEANVELEAATASMERRGAPQFYLDLWERSATVRSRLDALSFVLEYTDSMEEAQLSFSMASGEFEDRRATLGEFASEWQADPPPGMRSGSSWHVAGRDALSNLYSAKSDAIRALQAGNQLAADLQGYGDLAEAEEATVGSGEVLAQLHDWLELRTMQSMRTRDYFAAGPALFADSPPQSCQNYTTFTATPCSASGGRFNIDLSDGAFHWDDDNLSFDFSFREDTDIAPAFTVGTGQVPEAMFSQLAILSGPGKGPVEDYPLFEPMGGANVFAWWYPVDGTSFASYVRGPLDQVIIDRDGQTEGVNVTRLGDNRYSFMLASETFEDLLFGEDIVAVTLQWYNGVRVDQIVIAREQAVFVERPTRP